MEKEKYTIPVIQLTLHNLTLELPPDLKDYDFVFVDVIAGNVTIRQRLIAHIQADGKVLLMPPVGGLF